MAAGVLALAESTHAQTIGWNYRGGGSWSEAGNWGPAGVPIVAEFVTLYNLRVRDADLAPPLNVWNFFDVPAFIDAYTAGCP